MARHTEYIGLELLIRTDWEYDSYVEWFSSQDNYVIVMPCETHKALVYFQPLAGDTPEEAISRMCADYYKWPDIVREQWRRAAERLFYLGFAIGDEPFHCKFDISQEALTALTNIGASLSLGLYVQPDDSDDPE